MTARFTHAATAISSADMAKRESRSDRRYREVLDGATLLETEYPVEFADAVRQARRDIGPGSGPAHANLVRIHAAQLVRRELRAAKLERERERAQIERMNRDDLARVDRERAQRPRPKVHRNGSGPRPLSRSAIADAVLSRADAIHAGVFRELDAVDEAAEIGAVDDATRRLIDVSASALANIIKAPKSTQVAHVPMGMGLSVGSGPTKVIR